MEYQDSKQKTTRNIIEYLVNLDVYEFRSLYSDPYCCLSIYRCFDPMGQYFVRTMLYCGTKIWKFEDIYKLVKSQNVDACKSRLTQLLKLRIIETMKASNAEFRLNSLFQKSMITSLSTFSVLPHDTSPDGVKKERSFKKEETYAKEKWEKVLYYMIDQIDGDSTYIPPSERTIVQHLIHDAKLLVQYIPSSSENNKSQFDNTDFIVENEDELDDEDFNGKASSTGKKSWSITSEGFQFLLMDLKSQVWRLLQQYMLFHAVHHEQKQNKSEQKIKISRVEIIKFLFLCSYLHVGKVYHQKMLSPIRRRLLKDLAEFGILEMRKDRFYVTPLALEFAKPVPIYSKNHKQQQRAANDDSRQGGLTFPQSEGGTNEGGLTMMTSSSLSWKIPDLHGPIIVQNNFKVYAYTSSPIQIAVLRMFCELECRLPNLVVGVIRRITVRGALCVGITSAQIISYMTDHAHPKTRTLDSAIPQNVSKQIMLWEKERNRVTAENAVFYYDTFKDDESKFRRLLEFARGKGYVLYVNVESRWLVCKDHPMVEKEMENAIVKLGSR